MAKRPRRRDAAPQLQCSRLPLIEQETDCCRESVLVPSPTVSFTTNVPVGACRTEVVGRALESTAQLRTTQARH